MRSYTHFSAVRLVYSKCSYIAGNWNKNGRHGNKNIGKNGNGNNKSDSRLTGRVLEETD